MASKLSLYQRKRDFTKTAHQGLLPLSQGKRLAVETEDHRLDYGDFEGTISQGRVWRRYCDALGPRLPWKEYCQCKRPLKAAIRRLVDRH